MKNGNYLDVKVIIQPKKTMLKCFPQQLYDKNDMLREPQKHRTIEQNHAKNHRLESVQSSNSKILVVDDGEKNREILAIFLGEYGYDVVSAGNGQEAWYLFQKEHFDLVLTDICMPGMNGNDLTNQIKSQRNTLPVIAITGSSWLAEACFDEILIKPIWLHVLLDSVKIQLTKVSALAGMDAEDR